MPISDLARLASNRLHVVVFGPGYGEPIAVHVPDAGWLVCDSLSGTGRASGLVPAAELLGQRGERAGMLILTHPHDDHVAGFDRLVTRYASGPVGVVGIHLAQHGFTEGEDATQVLATSNRHKALAAIHRYWREHPERKWLLTADGTTRPLGSALIEVLHPEQTYLDAGRLDPGEAPNAYSTPVLVEWGAARIILGADLPTAEWSSVLNVSRDPRLAEHAALKVSHHGSMGSRAEELVLSTYRDSIATVTPWQLGRGLLPKLGEGGGIAWLLEQRAAVGLTSTGRAHTRPVPSRVSHSALVDSVQRRSLPGGAGTIEVKQSYDPDECWIAATFNAAGELESTEYGREARLVVQI